jgi:uncharacterized membrane protein HdeD (DUF308 family)
MGLLMEYFKNRWKEKRWLYVLDWIIDIALAAAFIYMSFQIREYMLHCQCPFCQQIPNISKELWRSVATPKQ